MDKNTMFALICGILIFVIMIIVIIIALNLSKGSGKKNEKKDDKNDDKKDSKEKVEVKKNDFEQVKKESIYKFMDFDDVKDNMIIRKNGEHFAMVIQCKGINFDLMSEDEKLAVEEGFTQFLNTLRFPVQLYVQTTSLDLSSGIDEYNEKISAIENEVNKLQQEVRIAEKSGDTEEAEKLNYQLRSKKNVLDYGKDIVAYISRMSKNKNVLQQKTYVIVNYYKAELGNVDLKDDEINDLVFSELYTRCETIASALLSASVECQVLNSEDLAELLYVAYNRDDANILDFDKALNMEYDALYSTSEDALKKKQDLIDKKLVEEGINITTEAIVLTDIREDIEKSKIKDKDKIHENAILVLERYKSQFDSKTYNRICDEINRIVEEKFSKKTKSTKKEKNETLVEEQKIQVEDTNE